MTRKRIYNLAFFLAIGVIFGLLIKYFTHFTWDFKVSAFDAFQLIVTAFLAWWVAEKLEKDSTIERCEKDILIEKIKAMDGIVAALRKIVLSSDIVPLTDVNRLIGSFDEVSNRVLETLEHNYSTILSDAENDYRDDIEALDNLCTNDGQDPDSIAVEERDDKSICIYEAERLNSILSSASGIQDKLFRLQLLLNRA